MILINVICYHIYSIHSQYFVFNFTNRSQVQPGLPKMCVTLQAEA